MIKFIEKLLSLIYTQPCYFCKSTKEDTILCSKCATKITFLNEVVFKRIKDTNVYACAIYDDVIKKLIKDFKYHKQKKLAPLQAKLMYEYWQKLNIEGDFLIIPVPIHNNRKKQRKYNHMDLVADELSKLTNYANNKNFVIRTKDTENQYKLKKQERIKNIKSAFSLDVAQNIPKERKFLIIDDITSTGTTLEEIIKLLNKNGYNDITAITLATPDF